MFSLTNDFKLNFVFFFFHLESEKKSNEQIGKKKKHQCTFCLESFSKRTLKKHVKYCQFHLQLIKNGNQCAICDKTFDKKHCLNQHIGHMHETEVVQLQAPKLVETGDNYVPQL